MSAIDALRSAKLQPLTLLLLLGGVVVVAYAILGVSLLRERWEKDSLSSEIAAAAATLGTAQDVQRDLADLQARLDEASLRLTAAQAAFPTELDSNVILQSVLRHANENQVGVLQANTQPPAIGSTEPDEEVALSGYSSLGFDFEVVGTFEQLVAFLAAIEDEAGSTSTIGDYSLQEAPGGQVLRLEVLSYTRSAVEEADAPETPEDPSSPAQNPPDGGVDEPSE